MPTRENRKQVAVVISFYKDSITAFEAISLEQCFKILAAHPIIAIKPQHLSLPESVTRYNFAEVINFDNAFFESIAGYNSLMLSTVFYQAFLNFEYILVYQLDAFVFEDKLAWWCTRGYDYIGAPWLRDIDHPDLAKKIKSTLKYYLHTRFDRYENGNPSKYQYENRSGNGGFSIRRVSKLYILCQIKKAEIENFLAKGDQHHFNEDRFLSVAVNRKRDTLKIPGFKTSVQFSFEMALSRALRLNKNQLPFGCHAWDRHLDFWRDIFKKYGYTI